MLGGHWTYRCYRNDPTLVGGDAAAALGMILAEGVLDLEPDGEGRFRGAAGAANGDAMTVEGTVLAGDGDDYAMTGLGISGTATAGWRYHYRCRRAYRWPEGQDQRESLVGTVLRVTGDDPLFPPGATACFIALQGRPPTPPSRALRRNALLAGQ
jgi:hypothetical protein